MKKITGWEAVVKALKTENVKFVFGLPSSPKDLYDALYDEASIKAIQVRHEAAGGFMAMSHSLLTGKPSLCFASQGPGIANLMPAILEALATCAPVIAICPGIDGRKNGKGAFQETDQIALMKPITKWAFRVEYAENIPWAINRAFNLAVNGKPGPIYIEIPTEIGRGKFEIPDYIKSTEKIRTCGDPKNIEQAAQLLINAKNPLIISGGGARHSRAHQEVKELAELLGVPIMTTPSGRGIITEDHPLSFGQVGLYRTLIGIDANNNADLMITIGSRNEEFQTAAWKLRPSNCKLIQIDIDPFEINRNWIADVSILGDAKLILRQLLKVVKQNKIDVWENRYNEYSNKKFAYELEVSKECELNETPIKSKKVVYELNKVFGKNTILINENGSQDLWSYYSPYYKVLDLNGNIAPGEQTCMGLGVMGAIGAKLANPEMKVVCVTGDGAFQMYNQDIPTAVQYDAPITWVILNTYSLGWPKLGQKDLGERYIATDFNAQPDFVQLAHSYGCYGELVDDPTNIADALKRALSANNSGKSAILNIIVDPEDVSEGFVLYNKLKK
ncbi:MAG TPA: thiamine pyrophosphate-binding protein [Syntrophomonadaceae bacterium]|nr:thiamine pyrophosphate-binding protein [Syntrophomonadaceae bacterium]